MQQNFISILQNCSLKIQNILRQSHTNYLNSTNPSGDTQLALDIQADKIIEEELLKLDFIKGICSEEKSKAIYKNNGSYLVAYDPLDGSSIIESNLSVGSIFGIYEKEFKASKLIGAAYIVYGPRLELIFAGDKLHYYVHTGEDWQEKSPPALKKKGNINATGGTQKYWETNHKKLIENLFDEGYRLRYSGGMVPDLHQILIKGGGLFSYPSTSDAPKGKLRKLFEVFPFAFIYEKAGGEAIDGKNRLLELDIKDLHESTACFLGSEYEIKKVRNFYE
ncbi:class 1 fructose-bisphosphatase [Helicobacter sp. 13S00477-4]|uniref:class 1 fructose-bisphosphatase n=1 Tax=Helicobacter sp. 13S00477-4 TaxID=1905759 RepID=UPI000BA72E58|nr:class 1 fructose-bisphosphatase [Helicobacter sp. 13S00477-4]PAF52446.1 fructose-bisphosphatase [Helicobacter sp. 13S00477-4]